MLSKGKIKLFVACTILFVLIPAPACEELLDIIVVDCKYCYTEKPEVAEVKLNITFDTENQTVPVTVYYGSYEDGLIAEEVTFRIGVNYIYLDVDEEYSFKATYKKNGLNYFVINGTRLKTHIDYETCSETCYYITGDEVDLRKKF